MATEFINHKNYASAIYRLKSLGCDAIQFDFLCFTEMPE